MLRAWAATARGALEDMIADIDAGRLMDDTLPRDMEFLRRLMNRRETLVYEINRHNGAHRGPGTAGWGEELGIRN